MSTADAPPTPPFETETASEGFDRVWRALETHDRFQSPAELQAALGEDAEDAWCAFLEDERFATSVVSQEREGVVHYQRFSVAAAQISSLLECECDAQTRTDICARLALNANDQVWSNIVKRLRFSTSLEVEAGANAPVRYSIPAQPGVLAETALSATSPIDRDTHPGVAPIARSPSLSPGDVIAERYEVIDVLGKGGFGIVYRGRQLNTDTPVAIKLLRPGRGHDPELLEHMAARFEREMQLLAQLNHPNIVKLYDSGQLPDGGLFTVLEYIDGVPLDRLLKTRGACSPREALRLMRQVANVLHHAHRQGVIHRDLKPANIMVTDPGPFCNAMVLDFGIASLQAPTPDERLTAIGHFLGTPHYMAPEQIRGEVATPQLDLYAWGLVFIETLTGSPVHTSDQIGKIMADQVSDTPIALPRSVADSAMGPIITAAVQKSPAARVASAERVLEALEDINPRALGGPSVSPLGWLTWPVVVGIICVVALIVAVAFMGN